LPPEGDHTLSAKVRECEVRPWVRAWDRCRRADPRWPPDEAHGPPAARPQGAGTRAPAVPSSQATMRIRPPLTIPGIRSARPAPPTCRDPSW